MGSGLAWWEREVSLCLRCGGCMVVACARGKGKDQGYRAGIPPDGGYGCVIGCM